MERIKILVLMLSFIAISQFVFLIPLTGAVNESKPYWGRITGTILPRTGIAIAASGTSFTLTFTTDGAKVSRYIIEIPSYTNTVTTTLSFVDAHSVAVFTGSALAKGANYSVPIDTAASFQPVDLVGTYTITLTLSGASGSVGTVYLTLFGQSMIY